MIQSAPPMRRTLVHDITPFSVASGVPQASTPAATWEVQIRDRLVAGDERALAHVYDQFSAFVHGLAVKVTRDRHAGEEIAQDVFLHLWEHPEGFDPSRGTLRAYLGTMTHRRSVDRVRREEARRRREDRDAKTVSLPPDVGEMATSLVVAERVRAAVDLLPYDQREALMLAYFGGKTYRQVAEAIGIPEGTAKSRLRLALRKVADVLESEGIRA